MTGHTCPARFCKILLLVVVVCIVLNLVLVSYLGKLSAHDRSDAVAAHVLQTENIATNRMLLESLTARLQSIERRLNADRNQRSAEERTP
jgi:hypothetical protein